MSDTTDSGKSKGKLGISSGGAGGKLSLKGPVEKRQTRQNFSHGRSKMVAVEVRKKRQLSTSTSSAAQADAPEVLEAPATAPTPKAKPEPAKATESDALAHLTPEERERRLQVLENARKAEEQEGEERARREQEEAVRAQEEAAHQAELAKAEPGTEEVSEVVEAPAETQSEVVAPVEDEPVETEEEAAQRVAEEQARLAAAEAAPKERARPAETEEEKRGAKGKKGARNEAQRKQTSPSRYGDRRRSGKLTIAEALGDDDERQRSVASVRRAREREKQKQRELLQEGTKVLREVVVPEAITVQELANRMAERGGEVVKTLMKLGVMATINQSIDADTAELVVEEFGHKIRRVSESDVEIGLVGDDDKQENLHARPPVVTVMGHVDHGKTSLLDALRATDVAAHEAGGITQHIGAYQVEMASGDKISFIDTPGHAAFTEMRARGAKVTDIVVLCVAADDGVMPQTIEAIDHAKAAEVPIIVAINKMDKPDSDPNRVRTELLQHDIQVEEMGGEVLSIEVSALKRMNLDKLEEAILLQSELLDLTANPERSAEGVVVEAKMEKGKGNVATVLVQRGALKVGDIFVTGNEWGRVRAMTDAYGNLVKIAGPSVPVEVQGLNGTPAAGDDFVVVESEARAREISEFRQRRDKTAQAAAAGRGTLEQMFDKIKEGEAEALPVVVKADVHGSLEAILGALNKLSTDEVKVQVLHSAVGGINESDVTLARASGALVVGFNVRANPQARDLAKRDGVEIRYYSIIYDLTDEIKSVLSGMLAPAVKENFLGYASIKEVFNISKVGKIAGCVVTEGVVRRGAKVRLLRDDTVIHEGDLSQLKRFKDDAKEVMSGMECGMAFANYHDLQQGDQIECFEVEEIARQL